MRIKVIIYEGIVEKVLADGSVEVEVIDLSKHYDDYEEIRAYEDELHKDKTLKSIDFLVAHFGDEV